MAKKVLGLLASPRRGGNSEMFLKEALLAVEGCEKEIVRLHELNISPCRACYRCIPKGASCIIKDDLHPLLDKIRGADGIILASPVYFLGPVGLLKNLLDRFISVGTDARLTEGKPALVLTSYGIKKWQGLGREFNNLLARCLSLDIKDSLLFHSPYPGQAILEGNAKEQIQSAAARLFDPASFKEPEPNSCPNCWNPYLSIRRDGKVSCPICGSDGTLRSLPGSVVQAEFSDTAKNRFTAEELYHHFGPTIQQTMAAYAANRNKVKELQGYYKQLDWDIKLD